MRVCWATNREVIRDSHAYGYTSSSVAMANALAQVPSVQLVDEPCDADVVVHYCHPLNFNPVQGKPNVLFTMYELDPPPAVFAAAARRADAVLTPSRFSAGLLRTSVPSSVPLVVVPLGFDDTVWRMPHQARTASDPFTFLYVGALNDRKGSHLVMRAFEAFDGLPGVRLVMKVNGTGPLERRRVVERGNVVFDDRALPVEALRELFLRAHAFVFPTLGEGFGLTALEAAACGLPVITSQGGAVGEFLDPKLVAKALPTTRHPLSVGDAIEYGRRIDSKALGWAMVDTVRDYPRHARRALKLAAQVHEGWTYRLAGQRLADELLRLARHGRWLDRSAA